MAGTSSATGTWAKWDGARFKRQSTGFIFQGLQETNISRRRRGTEKGEQS